MDTFAIHGGRLEHARRRFAGAPEPWIDLSTGVNALPYPAKPADINARVRLPDPEEILALEAAAGWAFGIEEDSVLATAGAESAIRLLANTLAAKRVAIVEPTYSGHGDAWRSAGASVVGIKRHDLAETAGAFDVVVVVNPNNPDGAVVSPDTFIDLAGRLAAKDGWLIVDEAFVEVSPETSVATRMALNWDAERLVALRSFGKFYGLPGLRLGFVTAHPDVVSRLRRRLGEWPVSADAIAAGRQAYADQPWTAQTRRRLAEDAARLDALLTKAGLDVVGGTSLFRLTAGDDVSRRFTHLAEAGVLTRPFADAPRWLRFGLPAPEHWPRVEAALLESAS